LPVNFAPLPFGKSLYNHHVMRFTPFAATLAAACLFVGCSKNIDTTEAVRQGVMDYLNSRAAKIGLDMNNMQVDVPAVTFDHDHARATVSVTPKIAGAKGMELVYNLDRKGDKWVVNGNAQSAGSTHGQEGAVPSPTPGETPNGTQLPPGHPAVGAAPPGAQLPPGHPAVGTPPAGTQLPPGHPAVGTKQQ
jgi:outer membrane murein-binding lipoprotein Lpp